MRQRFYFLLPYMIYIHVTKTNSRESYKRKVDSVNESYPFFKRDLLWCVATQNTHKNCEKCLIAENFPREIVDGLLLQNFRIKQHQQYFSAIDKDVTNKYIHCHGNTNCWNGVQNGSHSTSLWSCNYNTVTYKRILCISTNEEISYIF